MQKGESGSEESSYELTYSYADFNHTATVTGYSNIHPTDEVVIPDTVEYNNQTYTVTSIGRSAFNECTELTSVTIGSSVTSIGHSAFFYCSGLTSVTIPSSVISIGNSAFEGCSGLTSVTIGNSVTSIGTKAFSNCSSLNSISVDKDNRVYDSRDNCKAIIKTDNNTLIIGCKNTTFPNSVNSIGDYAFCDCSGLTSVTIGESVTSIGDWAFGYCSNLISVEIPNSVTSIGESAFYNCSGLTSVTIGNSVTSIGDWAFGNCTGLVDFILHKGSPEDFSWEKRFLFAYVDLKQATLHVPEGSVALYEAEYPWSEFGRIVGDLPGGEMGLEDIIADGEGNSAGFNSDEEIEYYDLNGHRINGDSLAPGVYILRQGSKTTKIFVN